MKKVLAGCLIVAVIAMVGLGVAGYYAFRMARPMIDRAREMSELGDRVVNKSPYVPPKNGELTPSQVERFLAVQTRVRRELDKQWREIETKTVSDLANIYIDARRAQVTALNTQKFSDAEYSWVRRRVWEATGIHLAGGMDMSAIEDLARRGAEAQKVELPDMPLPEVPEHNIRLVKPHLAKLKDWIPMAVLGL